MENPQDVPPQELLKNFQQNHSNRLLIVAIVGLFFAALLVLPILFSLKCDKTLGSNVAWSAIWTPMWIVDLFFLYVMYETITHVKKEKSSESSSETLNEDHHEHEDEEIPIPLKIYTFFHTIAFILIQVFVAIRLDNVTTWEWNAVFAPWYIYEGVTVLFAFHTAFLATIPLPSPPTANPNAQEGMEEGAHDDELLKQLAAEQEYFLLKVEKTKYQVDVVTSLLSIWQAIFLALELNNGRTTNWGLVFLPIWLYLLLKYLVGYSYRSWSNSLISEIDPNSDAQLHDPRTSLKLQQAQYLGTQASSAYTSMFMPLYISLLLVCRLQIATYSTFIILIPIFLIIGCCCFGVCCCLMMASCVDIDAMEQEMKREQTEQQQHPGGAAADATSGAAGGASYPIHGEGFIYVPPESVTVNPINATVILTNPATGETTGVAPAGSEAKVAEYGTFAPASSTIESQSSADPVILPSSSNSQVGASTEVAEGPSASTEVSGVGEKQTITAVGISSAEFDDIDW